MLSQDVYAVKTFDDYGYGYDTQPVNDGYPTPRVLYTTETAEPSPCIDCGSVYDTPPMSDGYPTPQVLYTTVPTVPTEPTMPDAPGAGIVNWVKENPVLAIGIGGALWFVLVKDKKKRK